MTEIVQMAVGAVVIVIGGLAALAYPMLQFRALRGMRGVWLLLAAVPLLPMVYIVVVTFMALGKGSSLWPILLIFTAPIGTAYLWVLGFVHRRFAMQTR